MKRSDRNSAQRGYSLLEALIAVAILAAIAAALAPALFASVRASGRIAVFASETEEERVARNLLKSLFDSAITLSATSEAPWFEGAQDRLKLAMLHAPADDPETAHLIIRSGVLYFASASDIAINADGDGTPEAMLFEGVSRFRYYGAADEREEPAWRSSWDADAPPLLVRVEFMHASGAMDFHVAARAPLNCVFDQVSRRCRS